MMNQTVPVVLMLLFSLSSARAQEMMVRDPEPHRASLLGPAHFSETGGQELYQVSCQACHMANAKGGAGAGAFPALAGNPKLADASYPLSMVMYGHRAMPSFAAEMSDAQIAAVITYVRTHFGNDYQDPLSIETVKAARAAKN